VGVWSIDSGGGSVATDASVAHETTGGATATFVDDGALPPLLFAADSAPARSASDCKPGTYTGMFVMMVDFMGISGLTLQGPLSITLVANKPSPHPGEFNSNTLTVAPGATFTGTDDLGDVITADLSGQLDCGTHMFVGTLSNGVSYVFGSDAWTPRVDGTMSGTYDPSVSPPALTNGSFTFTSADVPGTTGSGSWSATLQ
jgi:hypothetical protein